MPQSRDIHQRVNLNYWRTCSTQTVTLLTHVHVLNRSLLIMAKCYSKLPHYLRFNATEESDLRKLGKWGPSTLIVHILSQVYNTGSRAIQRAKDKE